MNAALQHLSDGDLNLDQAEGEISVRLCAVKSLLCRTPSLKMSSTSVRSTTATGEKLSSVALKVLRLKNCGLYVVDVAVACLQVTPRFSNYCS